METESLCCGGSSPESQGFSDAEISDELDHVPLIRRQRILLATQQRSNSGDCNGNGNSFIFGAVKGEEENEGCDALDVPSLAPACFFREEGLGILEQERYHRYEDPAEVSPTVFCNTLVGNCNQDVGASKDCFNDCSQEIKLKESDEYFPQVGNTSICTSPQSSTLLEFPPKVNVECSDNLLHSEDGGIDSSSGAVVLITKIKDEVCDYVADDHLDHMVLKERQRMLLSRKLLDSAKLFWEGSLDGDPLDHAVNLKEESKLVTRAPLAAKDAMNVSSMPTSFKIKDEPCDENNCHDSVTADTNTFFFNPSSMKTTSEISNELDEDDLDHMSLGDRLKLQTPQIDSKLNMSRNYEFFKEYVSSDKCSLDTSEHAKEYRTSRPRKKRKTATDSVETALDEDAPGLLQILVEKGVLIDEIKLYGETQCDEVVDESSESFSELESVIAKIFAQRQSFLKFAPIRCTKGARASYCLGCLISLVEQTRYLRFRKWPVEWGWCRDLQSFIFVFERHNRIVLERPEYGYATYFFELVDSLPIEWQIKRLVIAMKLTSCSRISLIENKALSVGEDLSEGEAKVLIEYGWVPNSGLGTMLNYRDRVIHDRKNEKDTSEWRSKIGKLLMDGYNGGSLVTTIPEKVVQFCRDSQNAQIKSEV